MSEGPHKHRNTEFHVTHLLQLKQLYWHHRIRTQWHQHEYTLIIYVHCVWWWWRHMCWKCLLLVRGKKEEELIGDQYEEHDWQKISNIDVSDESTNHAITRRWLWQQLTFNKNICSSSSVYPSSPVFSSPSPQFEGTRDAEDIRSFWQNFLHPSINKSRWSQEEVQQLKEVSRRHGERHWETIATELGVRRRSVCSCLTLLSFTWLSLSLLSVHASPPVCPCLNLSLTCLSLSLTYSIYRAVSLSSVCLSVCPNACVTHFPWPVSLCLSCLDLTRLSLHVSLSPPICLSDGEDGLLVSSDVPALRFGLVETWQLDASWRHSAQRAGGQDEDWKLHPLYTK